MTCIEKFKTTSEVAKDSVLLIDDRKNYSNTNIVVTLIHTLYGNNDKTFYLMISTCQIRQKRSQAVLK